MSTPDEVAAVADRLDGDIDALCNVAGVPGTLDPVTVLAVNFLAVRDLTERLADRVTGGGAIVHVASLAGAGWRVNLHVVERLVGTPSCEDGLAWAADQAAGGARAYNLSNEAVIVWAMQTCLRWWTVLCG